MQNMLQKGIKSINILKSAIIMRKKIPTAQTSAWVTLQIKQGRISVSFAELWVLDSSRLFLTLNPFADKIKFINYIFFIITNV